MSDRATGLAPIRADETYPLELFERVSGLGRTAIRMARRKGLRVLYVQRRAFVRGSDWLAYCDQVGRPTRQGGRADE